MGHLPIVKPTTLKDVITTGYISTRGDLKSDIEKTIASLFSDVLATRVGDPVYPWIIKESNIHDENLGFKYRFEIDSVPKFVRLNKFPIKIHLAKSFIEYDQSVQEEDALDLFREDILWNAIGKKSLQRGRSLTHQSLDEDKTLESMLGSGINREIDYIDFKSTPITINISQTQEDLDPFPNPELLKLEETERLMNINIEDIPWIRDQEFKTEKALEAWIMENIDSEEHTLSDYFPENTEIEWFGNYLPYGVSGKNIDIVVLHRDSDGNRLVSVIELKKGRMTKTPLSRAINQVKNYCLFIRNAFNLKPNRIYPMILCHLSSNNAKGIESISRESEMNAVKLIGYEVNDAIVNFEDF